MIQSADPARVLVLLRVCCMLNEIGAVLTHWSFGATIAAADESADLVASLEALVADPRIMVMLKYVNSAERRLASSLPDGGPHRFPVKFAASVAAIGRTATDIVMPLRFTPAQFGAALSPFSSLQR